MKPAIAVVGASGFIGQECVRSLEGDFEVRRVSPPRLMTRMRTLSEIRKETERLGWGRFAAEELSGIDVVVNAAGMATATSANLSQLLGANSMLPAFLGLAAQVAGARRFVHISSVAVQGRRDLDETERLAPENPYALSKAIGEILLRSLNSGNHAIRYRPTSVHGPERRVTRTLQRLAASPASVVACPGNDPTPQIPLKSVGNAVSALVRADDAPPSVVMHPWEGQTTESFMTALGGKAPRQVPRNWSDAAVRAAFIACPTRGSLRANAWRLDLMLRGQRQGVSWLDGRIPPPDPEWVAQCRNQILSSGPQGPQAR